MNQLLYILFLVTGCINSNETNDGDATNTETERDRILIIYLTRTNNTKAVAEMIQAEVGGDLVSLELQHPYPEDYAAIVKQVAEENASGFLPELKNKINLNKYDTVFLGFPTWGMQLPPPMKSFLSNNDFSGKTIIPFNSNAGYGLGQSIQQIKALCRDCKILNELSVKGGIERDGVFFVMDGEKETEVKEKVQQWLLKIKILDI